MNKSDFLVAVITSISSIVAIFVSASIARRAERENYKRQFLSDAYSNLFTRYTQWLDTQNRKDKGALIAALEHARLLSSAKTEALLEDFETAVRHNADISILGDKLEPLRSAMHSELKSEPNKKSYRKKRQQCNKRMKKHNL